MSAPVPPVVSPTPPPDAPPLAKALSVVLKVLAAAAITVLVIAAYVYFNEKPPVATGEVRHLSVYPVHRLANPGAGMQGMVGVEQKVDQVIVIAQVRLRNQSKGPLFVFDMFGQLGLPDQQLRSLAATTSDFDRVFVAYPQLASMKQPPLLRDTTIPAGATIDGELIFNYPITREQWDARRSMDVTVQFLHQKDLVMQSPQ